MTAIYDISTDVNWLEIYNDSFQATYVQGQQVPIYTPIPKTELPVDIDTTLVAIYCTSNQYQNSQRYLGSVYQAIITNTAFPTATATGKGRGIYSNQTVLAQFTEFDDNYRLVLNPRWWIEQLTVTVWKYIGDENFDIKNQLDAIEQKINQLL
jgi:hypothetical protein